eukprot:1316489-Prymnesium_polylepis.1
MSKSLNQAPSEEGTEPRRTSPGGCTSRTPHPRTGSPLPLRTGSVPHSTHTRVARANFDT